MFCLLVRKLVSFFFFFFSLHFLKTKLLFLLLDVTKGSVEGGIMGLGFFGFTWHWMELVARKK